MLNRVVFITILVRQLLHVVSRFDMRTHLLEAGKLLIK